MAVANIIAMSLAGADAAMMPIEEGLITNSLSEILQRNDALEKVGEKGSVAVLMIGVGVWSVRVFSTVFQRRRAAREAAERTARPPRPFPQRNGAHDGSGAAPDKVEVGPEMPPPPPPPGGNGAGTVTRYMAEMQNEI